MWFNCDLRKVVVVAAAPACDDTSGARCGLTFRRFRSSSAIDQSTDVVLKADVKHT